MKLADLISPEELDVLAKSDSRAKFQREAVQEYIPVIRNLTEYIMESFDLTAGNATAYYAGFMASLGLINMGLEKHPILAGTYTVTDIGDAVTKALNIIGDEAKQLDIPSSIAGPFAIRTADLIEKNLGIITHDRSLADLEKDLGR